MTNDKPRPNDQLDSDEVWMREALIRANQAMLKSEVPIGAVVVAGDQIIGEGFNHSIGLCDPTAHAEIQAIRAACNQTRNYRLTHATLYVTIEPCTMCLGAIMHSRIARVVFGACEPKAGVIVSQPVWQPSNFFNHTVQWQGGVLESECANIMTEFFSQRRKAKKELKNQ